MSQRFPSARAPPSQHHQQQGHQYRDRVNVQFRNDGSLNYQHYRREEHTVRNQSGGFREVEQRFEQVSLQPASTLSQTSLSSALTSSIRPPSPLDPEFGGRRDTSEEQLSQSSRPSATQFSSRHMPVMLPIIAPAKERLEKVCLTTNFFKVEVQPRTVFRYDVQMQLIPTANNRRVTDLGFGPKDDASSTKRHRLCLLALKRALELYRLFSDNGAFIYDSSSILFTSEDIGPTLKQLGRIEIPVEQLDEETLSLIPRDDTKAISIDIAATRDGHRVNITDFESAISMNLASIDRSIVQFYEILTNQDAVARNSHLLFGAGRLFSCNPDDHHRLRDGTQLVKGVEKGVRFIDMEQRSPNPVAALVLDAKRAMFFTGQSLLHAVCEVLGVRSPDEARWGTGSQHSATFASYLQNVRLRLHRDSGSTTKREFSFVFFGLSKEPSTHVMITLPGGRQISLVEYYAEQGIKLRFPTLPAVVHAVMQDTVNAKGLVTGKSMVRRFFPMELLSIIEGQRVPFDRIGKKPEPVKPQERWQDIYRQMEALNLHGGGLHSAVLRAFGVRVSARPLQVEGFRRALPQIQYGASRQAQPDRQNASWRSNNARYTQAGRVDFWMVAYDADGHDEKLVRDFAQKLFEEGRKRGMQLGDCELRRVPFEEMEGAFEQLRMKRESGQYAYVFLTYVDRSSQKSHARLKLYEAEYQVTTQHVTLEIARDAPRKPLTVENILNKFNCKAFGHNYNVIPEHFAQNRWVSKGDTMIIGYDIAHPDPMSRFDRLKGMGPTEPSTVGFSFNGGKDPEQFIGDYHFQEPRREEVAPSILEERIQWMLDTFQQKRGRLPEHIIVIRDGVSEGQFAMVVRDELGALRHGAMEFGESEMSRLEDGYRPRFAFLVATKRHHGRFAIQNGSRVENPLPLTTVDSFVTRPNSSEFYLQDKFSHSRELQAHRAIQGTAKAPLYTPLVDDIGMSADEIQSLMSVEFRVVWVGLPVSLPEPVYQADEWAKRGKNNFREYKMTRSVPTTLDGHFDFNAVTEELAYWGRELDGVRTNA